MDKDISNILCTKVDEHAGDWPSESFLELFRIAKKCVEPKMSARPEIDGVSVHFQSLGKHDRHCKINIIHDYTLLSL